MVRWTGDCRWDGDISGRPSRPEQRSLISNADVGIAVDRHIVDAPPADQQTRPGISVQLKPRSLTGVGLTVTWFPPAELGTYSPMQQRTTNVAARLGPVGPEES